MRVLKRPEASSRHDHRRRAVLSPLAILYDRTRNLTPNDLLQGLPSPVPRALPDVRGTGIINLDITTKNTWPSSISPSLFLCELSSPLLEIFYASDREITGGFPR